MVWVWVAWRVGASCGEETLVGSISVDVCASGVGGVISVRPASFRALSSGPLRLPNTTVLHAMTYLARNFSMNGGRNDFFGFFASPRPVRRWAICRNISVVRWLGAISAIIWPLFAADPNTCGSNGMLTIGWLSMALANSLALISGRFGTPTWLRQYSGGRSFGRAALSKSNRFFVLRRLARSGVATMRISSAPIRARLVQPDH